LCCLFVYLSGCFVFLLFLISTSRHNTTNFLPPSSFPPFSTTTTTDTTSNTPAAAAADRWIYAAATVIALKFDPKHEKRQQNEQIAIKKLAEHKTRDQN
jgi:hypothetical protein